MTDDDNVTLDNLRATFTTIRELLDTNDEKSVAHEQDENVLDLVDASITVLEIFFVNIHRIADALEKEFKND